MIANRKFTFKTYPEAEAFQSGVEYVNDSAITVLNIEVLDDHTYVVCIHDEDEDD